MYKSVGAYRGAICMHILVWNLESTNVSLELNLLRKLYFISVAETIISKVPYLRGTVVVSCPQGLKRLKQEMAIPNGGEVAGRK